MNWSESMPDILAEIRGSWLDGKQAEFLKAVHNAVVESLQTPGEEPLARLLTHSNDSYLIPKAAGERFTRIEIVLFKGRTLEAKRQLYQTIVRNVSPFGIPSEDVKVVLVEVTSEDVGFRGGQAACDVDLGYSTKV
jgi:Tautomerase enzyme